MKTTTLCRILSVVFLLFSTSYGREIVADAGVIGKPGVFPLIQAALDFANDGDEIVIRKGSYPESILITKAVSLKGEAGQVVMLTGNSHSSFRTVCRIKDAAGCTLENLVFKPVYSEPIRTPVVTIDGGTVTFNRCTIQEGGLSGLAVQSPSTVKMNQCAILNHSEWGALFSESVVEISNCRFEGNGKDGARVRGTAGRLTVTGSTFANNAEHGLYLYELDAGTLTGNVCEKNGFNGIYVHSGKEATLSDNRCIQNGRNGLSVEGKNLKVTITRNLAKENQWGGIYAGQGVKGNLTGNEAIGNLNHGIVLNDTDASCRENLCQGNQRSGIRAENGAMGSLQKNTFRDNQEYGIAVGDTNSKPVCSDNIFEKNKKGQMYVEESPIGGSTPKKVDIPQFAQVRQMLVQGEYDKLDRIAADLIDTNKRNEEGTWQLTWFYRYLAGYGATRPAESRQSAISAAEKWMAQSPKSQTPAAALATMYCNLGWSARGSGYADKVTEEGWKIFNENLGKGLAVLDAAEKREIRDPEFYSVKLIIGRGLSKPDNWMQEAFQEGISVKNDYQSLYQQMAENLLPKWGGSSRALREFADSAIRPDQKDRSHVLYAYIAAWVYGSESSEGFMNHQLNYQNIKLGCEQLLALYPNSANNANRLCMFACMYKDKDTARKLFPKVEEAFVPEMWKNDRDYCLECKTWAFSEDKPAKP